MDLSVSLELFEMFRVLTPLLLDLLVLSGSLLWLWGRLPGTTLWLLLAIGEFFWLLSESTIQRAASFLGFWEPLWREKHPRLMERCLERVFNSWVLPAKDEKSWLSSCELEVSSEVEFWETASSWELRKSWKRHTDDSLKVNNSCRCNFQIGKILFTDPDPRYNYLHYWSLIQIPEF